MIFQRDENHGQRAIMPAYVERPDFHPSLGQGEFVQHRPYCVGQSNRRSARMGLKTWSARWRNINPSWAGGDVCVVQGHRLAFGLQSRPRLGCGCRERRVLKGHFRKTLSGETGRHSPRWGATYTAGIDVLDSCVPTTCDANLFAPDDQLGMVHNPPWPNRDSLGPGIRAGGTGEQIVRGAGLLS